LLDVKEGSRGDMAESRFREDMLSRGVPDDLSRRANEDLLALDLNAGGAGFAGDTGDGRGGEWIGDRDREQRGFSGTSGVKASSFVSGSSGDFDHEGCRPLNPPFSAENLSPSPREVLQSRAGDESVWGAGRKFRACEPSVRAATVSAAARRDCMQVR
jgi:hypothetical protein